MATNLYTKVAFALNFLLRFWFFSVLLFDLIFPHALLIYLTVKYQWSTSKILGSIALNLKAKTALAGFTLVAKL